MQRKLPCVVVVALLVVVAMTAMAQSKSQEVAVVVNGENIYTWELALLLPQIQAEMTSQGLEPKGSVVIRSVLDRAIDSKLIAQEARRRGIKPNESRVDEKLAKMAAGAGSRADLEAELVKTGIDYSQLRSTVVQADLVQTLVEAQVATKGEVTPDEVLAFYNQNPELFKNPDRIHARHILFKFETEASPEQKKAAWDKAAAAHARAVAGEDFAALAIELSEGPNASKGGDLGFTTRGQMVESFDQAVWALKPGEISEVVESRFGYHVIKVEEIRIGPTVPLEEARPAVVNLLRQERIAQVLSELVTELKASAEIRDPEL
jgi:peptidyl-prolyl cis-trans isomerase C